MSIHDTLALPLSRCLQEANIPGWMTKGKTTLIQKDPQKGTILSIYRPITCQSMMRKILIAPIWEELYYLFLCYKLFFKEWKGSHIGTRGIDYLLYIDQHIHKESKEGWKNIAMVWIDYKKAYDMVPQSWIVDCPKMYKTSDKVIKFIMEDMKNWKVELTAGGKTLAENPERHLPRKCTDVITIFNSNDATI